MVSAIDSLPEERRGDLTAGPARIGRLTLLATVPAEGPVDFQCCHNPGEKRLSNGDEDVIRDVGVLVRGAELDQSDRVSHLSQPYGDRGSCVAHRFVLSLSLPIAARSSVMRSQVAAGDGGA